MSYDKMLDNGKQWKFSKICLPSLYKSLSRCFVNHMIYAIIIRCWAIVLVDRKVTGFRWSGAFEASGLNYMKIINEHYG